MLSFFAFSNASFCFLGITGEVPHTPQKTPQESDGNSCSETVTKNKDWDTLICPKGGQRCRRQGEGVGAAYGAVGYGQTDPGTTSPRLLAPHPPSWRTLSLHRVT